jgi:hypothetical protein
VRDAHGIGRVGVETNWRLGKIVSSYAQGGAQSQMRTNNDWMQCSVESNIGSTKGVANKIRLGDQLVIQALCFY